MIKQGTVQETLADLNGSTSGVLPPLHNLPHWSRVNNLDKGRYPKPFLKDRLQPLPNPSEMDVATAITIQAGPGAGGSESPEELQVMAVQRGVNSGQRIIHLEKSIYFLQQQHHEVLSNLHEEIDCLKRENKELNFRIVVMQEKTSKPGSANSDRAARGDHPPIHRDNVAKSHAASSYRVPRPPSIPKYAAVSIEMHESPHMDRHSQGSDEKIEELKIIFLEEEIKDLKKALKDERACSHHLQQLVDHSGYSSHAPQPDQKAHSAGPRGPIPQPHPPSSPRGQEPDKPPAAPTQAYNTPPSEPTLASQPLPYNANVGPLRVQLAGQAPRTPTIKECETILKHLQKVIDSQAHELNQLKTDLRDVLYSHKWTPDAFLLAKAYVAEDDAREQAEQSRLPRIELKHSTRKLPEMAYMSKDALSLPALNQTMGNKAIERRRRHQIIQKSRVNKELAN